jgi:hypothetical protein
MKKPKLEPLHQHEVHLPFRFATVEAALEFHGRPSLVDDSDRFKRYMSLTVPPRILDEKGMYVINPAYVDAPFEEVYLAQEKSPYDKKD